MSRYKLLKIIVPLLLLLFATQWARAETFEVKLLSRSDHGSDVFEPDYLAVKPGDHIIFKAVHTNHNAASIAGMIPEGATAFNGKIGQDLEVTFDKPGFYGIKCTPHYGMGMVMLIKVGEASLPQSYRDHSQPNRAKSQFNDIFKRVDEDNEKK